MEFRLRVGVMVICLRAGVLFPYAAVLVQNKCMHRDGSFKDGSIGGG